MKRILLFFCFIVVIHNIGVQAQTNYTGYSVVTTAVPFLRITGDARSASFGEINVVSLSKNLSIYHNQNPSLMAGMPKGVTTNFNYTSWLRSFFGKSIFSEMYLLNLNTCWSIDEKNVVAYNFKYFDLGTITLTDVNGEITGEFNPKEMVHALSYSRLLSKKFRLGARFKYIYSNLATGQFVVGKEIKTGHAIAADIGFDYREDIKINKKLNYLLNIGLAIHNFGTKIYYVDEEYKDFIPTDLNMGLATGLRVTLKDSSSNYTFKIAYQTDKLMVPTPSLTDDNNNNIADYREKSVIKGVFGSFSDAPGGAKEELAEFIHHLGSGHEFVIKRKYLVAAHQGVFLEHEEKGNRKYFTWGLSLGFFGFTTDFSYLHQINSTRNPISNTWRVNVGCIINLDKAQRFMFN